MKILILISLIFSALVYSHSGNTDWQGCHTNHKTGVYHCHNPK